MDWRQIAGFALLALAGLAIIALLVWVRRAARTPSAAAAELRALGVDLLRLPGRLRRVAADPRTPRRARWWLIGLAIYVASPIDLIPDFLPGIGHLDELILVPLVLAHVRRMIPPEVWREHFPPRAHGAESEAELVTTLEEPRLPPEHQDRAVPDDAGTRAVAPDPS